MAEAGPDDTEQLLAAAQRGDAAARDLLLQRFRRRLRQMIAIRLDTRLAARVDPSDVVQETLAEAARKLPGYLAKRPLPFYPWLRQMAWERLVKLHRRHLHAKKRSVKREERNGMGLSAGSVLELIDQLLARDSGPDARLRREEARERVHEALRRLADADREVLVLRHLEQVPTDEIAAILGVSEAAVYTRHLRAVRRLHGLLGEDPRGDT